MVTYQVILKHKLSKMNFSNFFAQNNICKGGLSFIQENNIELSFDGSGKYYEDYFTYMYYSTHKNSRAFIKFNSKNCRKLLIDFLKAENITANKFGSFRYKSNAKNINTKASIQTCASYHYTGSWQVYYDYVVNSWIIKIQLFLTIIIVTLNLFMVHIFLQFKNPKPVILLLSALAISDSCTAIFITMTSYIEINNTQFEVDIGKVGYVLLENLRIVYVFAFVRVFHLNSVCIT